MSNKLFLTLKPSDSNQTSSSESSPVWMGSWFGFFQSFFSTEEKGNKFTPSFQPQPFHLLSIDATHQVAQNYLSKVFEPQFDLTEKELEELSSQNPLGEALHILASLSFMEKQISKWNKKHPSLSLNTPKKVYLLYQKLFDRTRPTAPSPTLQISRPTFAIPRLINDGLINCSINVVLHTLFYNVNIAKELVFSQNQPPELLQAFLLYHRALQNRDPQLLDLASPVRESIRIFNDKHQHDAAEVLCKFLEPAHQDSSLFSLIERKTSLAEIEKHSHLLASPLYNGCLREEMREAVYTIEVPQVRLFLLEELLFTSFNEVVTDETPVMLDGKKGAPPVEVRRTSVQTRYVTAPKFLIYNLSRSQYLDQPIKNRNFVGVQRFFYLNRLLTVDNRGAKYRLLSFNVHIGDTTTAGHYLHYREVDQTFLRLDDSKVDPIPEIEYLLEAQSAYVLVFERIDKPLSDWEFDEGVRENQENFEFLIFLNNLLAALNGQIDTLDESLKEPTELIYRFMTALISQDSVEEAFSALPDAMRSHLLALWSEDSTLEQLTSTLSKHAKKTFLIPKNYSEEIFLDKGQILLSMMDLMARRAKDNPKERALPNVKLLYESIIHASGKLSQELHQDYQDRYLFRTTLIREVGQLALTVGVFAFQRRNNSKPLKVKDVRGNTLVVAQGFLSLSNCVFSYIDPRKQNPYIQFVAKYLHPALKVKQGIALGKEGKLQRYSPLVAPLTDLGAFVLKRGLGHEVSELAQRLTSTALDSALTYRVGTTHDCYLQLFSSIYSWASPPISERLQGETNPLRWRTSVEAARSNFFHILFTNAALQSMITRAAADKFLEERVYPLKKKHQSTYEELSRAIDKNDAPKIRSLISEIEQLDQQLGTLGVRLDQESYAQETLTKLQELDNKNLKLNEYYTLYKQLSEASDPDEENHLIEKLKSKEEELSTLGIKLPPELSIHREQEIQKKIQAFNALVENHQDALSKKEAEKAKECQSELLELKEELENLGIPFELEALRKPPPIIPDPIPPKIQSALSLSKTSSEIIKDTDSRKEKFYRVHFTIDGQTQEIGKVKSREQGDKLIAEFNTLVKKRDAKKEKIRTNIETGLQNGMKASEIPPIPDLSFPKLHIDAPTGNGKLRKNDQVTRRFRWAQWVNPFEKCRAELESEIKAWETATDALVTTFNSQITPFAPVIVDYEYKTDAEGEGKKARYYVYREDGYGNTLCKVYDEKTRVDCIIFDKNVAASVNELHDQMFQQRLLAKQFGVPDSKLPALLALPFPKFGIFVTGDTVLVNLDGTQICEKKGNDAYRKAVAFLEAKKKKVFDDYKSRTDRYCEEVKAQLPPLYMRHMPKPVSYVAGKKDRNKYVYETSPYGHQMPHGPFPTFESRDAYRSCLGSSKIIFDECSEQLDHLQEQMLAAGVEIEDLPPAPSLEAHDYKIQDDGKHVTLLKNGSRFKQWKSNAKGHESAQERLSTQLNIDGSKNRNTVKSHMKTLQELTSTPLVKPPKLKSSERQKRAAVLIPPGKKEKEHGFFYRTYRSVSSAPDRFKIWLDNHGIELSIQFRTTSKLYDIKTPSESSGPRYLPPPREPAETRNPIENVGQTFTYDPHLQIPYDPNTPLILPNPIQPQLYTAIPPRHPVPLPEHSRMGLTQQPSPPSVNSTPLEKKPEESFLSKLKPKPQRISDQNQNYTNLFLRHFLNPDRSLDYRERIEENTVLFTAHAKDVMHTAGFLADVGQNIYNFVDNTAHGRLEFTLDRSQSEMIDAWMDQTFPRIDPKAELAASLVNEVYLQVFTGGGAAFVRLQRAGSFFKKATVITSKSIRAGLRNPLQIGKLPLVSERLAITSQKTALRETAARVLAKRKIVQLTPIKIPPLQRGAELSWWKQTLPKLEKLTRHLDGKSLYKGIRKEFASEHLSESQVRRVLHHAGFKTYPRPRGLQSGFSTELAKKRSGMIYRKIGTTDKQNVVVRVMQGIRKENAVTATIKGKTTNGRWRQQTPYVVQRRGNEYLSRDGKWIERNEQALTHIPLEIYEFKGW